jgi:hypothetical protein
VIVGLGLVLCMVLLPAAVNLMLVFISVVAPAAMVPVL